MPSPNETRIQYPRIFHRALTTPKRLKIFVGGRGSIKTTTVCDYVSAMMMQGQLWCCAREFQNSIDESVHRTMQEEIGRLGLSGFTWDKNHIYHASEGRNFYRGLSRNITSLKGVLTGVDGLWIEEGESLTADTIRILTASLRLTAADAQRKLAGEDVKMPEIIITMNRGSRADPVSTEFLAHAEPELQRCGYYEDEYMLVQQVNYTDIPQEWFDASGLEIERANDELKMTAHQYRHKWLGDYLDEVDNAIIKPEWFDACIDAHKRPGLEKAFEPRGAKIAAHDPSDTGEDSKGYALRHGSIIRRVAEMTHGEIDEGMDWATAQAIIDGADWFVWDGDGMGAGLKRQASQAFNGKPVKQHIFRGSLSGSGQDNAGKLYQPSDDEVVASKTYAETFKNNRSQYYIRLADRMYNTYKHVVRGEYIDPDDMLSIDSDGVESMDKLRSELCRIPKKDDSKGLIQIMSKSDMKKHKIDSPNLGDSVMMTMINPTATKKKPQLPRRRVAHCPWRCPGSRAR